MTFTRRQVTCEISEGLANTRIKPTRSARRFAARSACGLCAGRYAARRQQGEVARAFRVALRRSVLSSTRARHCVGGCVILRGSVRVAGTRGRVR